MTDEPFDDVDRALAHGLSALAPEVDGDETLAALRPRFRRARTRRRAARIGATFVALAVVGTAAALVAPSTKRSHVQVLAPPSTRGTTGTTKSSTSVTTTTRPGSSPSPTTPTTVSTPNASTPNPSGGPSRATTNPTVPGGTVPDDGHGGGRGPSGGGDDAGPGSTTTVPSASELHTYTSPGGRVTVRFSHGRLQLLRTSAADGYQASVPSRDPFDVEVRFDRSGDHGEWRIRVQVDHDGHLSPEITQS